MNGVSVRRQEEALRRRFMDAGFARPKTIGERVEDVMAKWGLLHRMSFLTATNTEVIYSNGNVATQLNTFTTEDNLQKTWPPIIIPAGFFYNLAAAGKSLKVKAIGRLGTTGSPTFNWSLRLLTSTTWSAAGILLGATGAVAAGATKTLSPFFIDLELILTSLGIAGASSIKTMGEVRGPSALASPFAYTMPADNTSPIVSTVDNAVTYNMFLSVACGTSNAANLIQLEGIKVFGEN